MMVAAGVDGGGSTAVGRPTAAKEIVMSPCAHTFRAIASASLAVLLAGCATSPEIVHDTNPAAEFARYKTFGFFTPLATDKAGYETVFTARLKDSTRRAMEAKGYVYRETGGDLLVNFFANVQDRQEVRSVPDPVVPMGYYGFRGGYYRSFGYSSVQTIRYREGTLTIDLVESRRNILAWQATAEGTVSDQARRDPGPAIEATVQAMMAPLPAASK